MPDVISTLALRVSSGEAVRGLQTVARESEALGAVTDQLKGKILSVVSGYVGWTFGKDLLANAVQGEHAAMRFSRVFKNIESDAERAAQTLTKSFYFDDAGVRQSLSLVADKLRMTGLTARQSLDFSTELHKAAADFAAYSQEAGGTEQILRSMQMAITGNTRALMQHGIVLDDDAIKAEKAAQKEQGFAFATDKAATANARLTVLLKQTSMATGIISENMDSYANRLRRFQARWSDLKGNLGATFLPVASKVVDVMGNIVNTLNDTSPAMKTLMVTTGAATGAFLAFGPTIIKLAVGLKAVSAAKALETLATQKETVATGEETAAMAAQNAVASTTIAQTEAIVAAKTAETAARLRNARVIASESMGTKAGKLGSTFNNVSSLASAARPGLLTTGAKTEGLLVKLAKPLGTLNSRITSIITTIGSKLPLVRTFGSVFFKVAGMFGTATTVVGGVVAALEVFKHAPQWIEVALDKLPGVISSIGEKAVDGLKKFGTAAAKWSKDLVIEGLLGIGQTTKRLFGLKTEATRAYELNKQIEENNRRRQAALEAEKALRQAESAMLTAQRTLFQSQTAANVKYATSLDNDAVKLEKAIQERDRLSAQLTESQRKFAEYQAIATGANSSTDQRQEATERANALVEEMKELNDQWEQSAEEVTKLAEAVHSASKSFEQDQKNFDKQRIDAQKSVEEAQKQNILDSAQTHAQRSGALQGRVRDALMGYQESQTAQSEADSLNNEIQTIQKQLQNEKVSRSLSSLQKLAESGDVTSNDAELTYAAAMVNLEEAGYGDITSQSQGFGQGSALNLLRRINEARKEQEKELADKIAERDEKQSIANEAGSRLSSYNQAQRAVADENKAFAEQTEEERRQKSERERQLNKENATFQRSIDETLFNRQLQASDQYFRNDAYGAAWSRYGMIGARGEQEWNASVVSLKEQQTLIDEITKQLEPLEKRFREGTLTEEDTKQREYLRSQKDTLESEYRSDYQNAIQKRLQTEDTLLGLENTMRSEYLKQAQAYVDEEGNALRDRLTVEAQAQEEEQKKRLEERSKVEEEARQAVTGIRAITAGSSEAFNIASKIYERGQETLPPEKKIEKSTQKIEEYVKAMQEQMMTYFAEQSGGMTLSLGY